MKETRRGKDCVYIYEHIHMCMCVCDSSSFQAIDYDEGSYEGFCSHLQDIV
jgi:hypothetical protein